MEPLYPNGSVALMKQTGFDYDGAVYALIWNGKTYIKKVYRETEGLRLESINPDYDIYLLLTKTSQKSSALWSGIFFRLRCKYAI